MNYRMMNHEDDDDDTESTTFERMPKKRRFDDEGRGHKLRDNRQDRRPREVYETA